MFNDSDRDKLHGLAKRIERAEEAAQPSTAQTGKSSDPASRSVVRAIRLGSDFIALVMGLAFFGWLVDRQLDCAPWFMLGMIVVGFIAGFWMIVRVVTKTQEDQDQNGEVKE